MKRKRINQHQCVGEHEQLQVFPQTVHHENVGPATLHNIPRPHPGDERERATTPFDVLRRFPNSFRHSMSVITYKPSFPKNHRNLRVGAADPPGPPTATPTRRGGARQQHRADRGSAVARTHPALSTRVHSSVTYSRRHRSSVASTVAGASRAACARGLHARPPSRQGPSRPPGPAHTKRVSHETTTAHRTRRPLIHRISGRTNSPDLHLSPTVVDANPSRRRIHPQRS